MALPKLIALDLDFTSWTGSIEEFAKPPVSRRGQDVNCVYDAGGHKLSFYEDIPELLLWIREKNIHLAAVSRTLIPDIAYQALNNLYIPYSAPSADSGSRILTNDPLIPAVKVFDTTEIYPKSKITHFNKIHQETNIPYSDMLFFDDEKRNSEVGDELGVTFILVPKDEHHKGLNRKIFDEGIETWRKRQNKSDSS